MKQRSGRQSVLFLAAALSFISGQSQIPAVHNKAGVLLTVDSQNNDPALTVEMPDGAPDKRTFTILLPEHVTARPRGHLDGEHLYIFEPGEKREAPRWRRRGDALEYASNFGGIHFLARATLVNDGVIFHYEFVNHTVTAYDMITAVTDPRFHAVFYDPKLERTYVHYSAGFQLLASETPGRIGMPLSDWFPVRYLAPYSEPVPSNRVQRSSEGITRRYTSRAVDVPMIATISEDGKWIAASFSRDPTDVWSNPELTCQHVDPQVPLPAHGYAQYEMKILLFPGSLNDALRKVRAQLPTLR